MTYASCSSALHRLIYFSTFSAKFPTEREQQDKEIAHIVRVSILNNSESALTGLLLAHQNWFLQVLEGPRDRLMNCYGVIASDTRHVDPTLMGVYPIPKRNFYNWDMCSRRLNENNSAVLEALDVKGPFSPKTLNFENALKLLRGIRVIKSRPEPLAA